MAKMTEDDGGGKGVWKTRIYDDVICERSLILYGVAVFMYALNIFWEGKFIDELISECPLTKFWISC